MGNLFTDGPKARIHRKIAYVYAADRNYTTALNYLERAAEYAMQEGRDELQADRLWVEAAEMAIEVDDGRKALSYIRKALVHNPENRVAKGMLKQLSSREPSGF